MREAAKTKELKKKLRPSSASSRGSAAPAPIRVSVGKRRQRSTRPPVPTQSNNNSGRLRPMSATGVRGGEGRGRRRLLSRRPSSSAAVEDNNTTSSSASGSVASTARAEKATEDERKRRQAKRRERRRRRRDRRRALGGARGGLPSAGSDSGGGSDGSGDGSDSSVDVNTLDAWGVPSPAPQRTAADVKNAEGVLARVATFLRARYNNRSLVPTFLRWEKEFDGRLTREDMATVLGRLGTELTVADTAVLHAAFDRDYRGRINYKVFVEAIEAYDAEPAYPTQDVPVDTRRAQLIRKYADLPAELSVEDMLATLRNRPIRTLTIDKLIPVLRSRCPDRRSLLDLFQGWDANNDGHIQAAELNDVLSLMGVRMRKKDLHTLFKVVPQPAKASAMAKRLRKANNNPFFRIKPPPGTDEKVSSLSAATAAIAAGTSPAAAAAAAAGDGSAASPAVAASASAAASTTGAAAGSAAAAAAGGSGAWAPPPDDAVMYEDFLAFVFRGSTPLASPAATPTSLGEHTFLTDAASAAGGAGGGSGAVSEAGASPSALQSSGGEEEERDEDSAPVAARRRQDIQVLRLFRRIKARLALNPHKLEAETRWFDGRSSDVMSCEELRATLRRLNVPLTLDDIQCMQHALDPKASGVVSIAHFKSRVMAPHAHTVDSSAALPSADRPAYASLSSAAGGARVGLRVVRVKPRAGNSPWARAVLRPVISPQRQISSSSPHPHAPASASAALARPRSSSPALAMARSSPNLQPRPLSNPLLKSRIENNGAPLSGKFLLAPSPFLDLGENGLPGPVRFKPTLNLYGSNEPLAARNQRIHQVRSAHTLRRTTAAAAGSHAARRR